MRQITGGDALFLYTDKQSRHQHISILYCYDQSTVRGGTLRFKTILEHMEQRLGASPIYRQRLVQVPLNLDYPYWINDPDFDLEYHVRHIALPQPGDWRQLCIQVSRLRSRPLDMTRPVWEMYVIEGLNKIDFLPAGSFAVLTKIHHTALDGVAAAELTMGIHDLEPYPQQSRRTVRWRSQPEPRPAELLARALVNNTRSTFRTGSTLGRKLLQAATTPRSQEQQAQDKSPTPVTRFNRPISPHRVWDAVRFDLDDFRLVKSAVSGATINDVVLTVCGGAMRQYLASKRELPEISLTSMVPVSVRTTQERGAGGNKVHLTRARLMTQEADPLKRLSLVRDEMTKLKALNAVGARDLVDMQEQLPAPTLLLAGRAVAASRGPGRAYRASHNMVVTNVPGPQHKLYFCGARLAMFTGLAVITDDMGISHAVTSYDGCLVIAPLSDREMMPDPAYYAQCLQEAFHELKQAVVTAGKTGSRTRRITKAARGPARAKGVNRPKSAAGAGRGKAAPRATTRRSKAR